jgi:hypothetical protein
MKTKLGVVGCLVNRFGRRFAAARARRRKVTDAWGWLARWDAACARSWAILSNGKPTRERFERWERNHTRLCRIIEAKNGCSPNAQHHAEAGRPIA